MNVVFDGVSVRLDGHLVLDGLSVGAESGQILGIVGRHRTTADLRHSGFLPEERAWITGVASPLLCVVSIGRSVPPPE